LLGFHFPGDALPIEPQFLIIEFTRTMSLNTTIIGPKFKLMRHHKLLNLDIMLGDYDEFMTEIMGLARSNGSGYVCLVNVHMFIEAQMSQPFLNVVNHATIATPDGMPIAWALKFLYGIKQPRVAGMDLLPDLLARAEASETPVFFYGSTEKMLATTRKHLHTAYPNLQVAGTLSPPFRPLTPEEEGEHVQIINRSGAKLVFVVLGCPKQEYWMSRMTSRINAVLIGVGGALPVMVGEAKRAPQWMQNSGLEWLFRLFQEPGRLWKRYLSTNWSFIKMLVVEKFKKKNS